MFLLKREMENRNFKLVRFTVAHKYHGKSINLILHY